MEQNDDNGLPFRKRRTNGIGKGVALLLAGSIFGSLVGGAAIGLYFQDKMGNTNLTASQQAYIEQVVAGAMDNASSDAKKVSSAGEEATVEKTIYNEVNKVTTDYSTTVQNVAEAVSKSVVGVATGEGTGTGLVVSSDGLILTNQHVIEVTGNTQMFRPNMGMNTQTDSTITVTLVDGKEYTAEVLFSDEDMDLAVIKIDATGLTAATLGDSDNVSIGEIAIAIGNPLGLEQTVTSGIVSALGVSAAISNTQIAEELIQTDAAINSGNSGGPLLNADGEVIGVTSYKLSDGEGIGFAIPVNAAKPIVQQIIESGEFKQPKLGVSLIDTELLSYYNYNITLDHGLYVYNVDSSSDAYAKGLSKGDIITAVAGVTVNTQIGLKEQIYQHLPGDSVTLTVERSGNTVEITVTLGTAD